MSSDVRLDALNAWLERVLPVPISSIAPATSDASFRRYFRITLASELDLPSARSAVRTLIAMDAPPEREDSSAFVKVAGLLAEAGLNAPRILEADLAQGFLLVTDLGTRLYLQALQESDPLPLFADASNS